jgi:hypothetical protein
VIPTVGRESLDVLLDVLAASEGPHPGRVLVVDDRRDRSSPLEAGSRPGVEVVVGRAAGPAAARNAGWRASDAPWIVFVDDDVVPTSSWLEDLDWDLSTAALDVVAVQGRVTVPLPSDRRPTDWERNVTGLETAKWITADMAVRRSALEKVGGFDERFPRAYREDADLALRLQDEGGKLAMGRRRVTHPVRPAPWWISVPLQAGNRDDVLMAALHGRDWQGDGAPRGRRRRHVATTASGLIGLGAVAWRRPRVAVVGLAGWAVGTAELAWARVAPGPRTRQEVGAMVATSVALPPVATWHWVAGRLRRRRLLRSPGPTPELSSSSRPA